MFLSLQKALSFLQLVLLSQVEQPWYTRKLKHGVQKLKRYCFFHFFTGFSYELWHSYGYIGLCIFGSSLSQVKILRFAIFPLHLMNKLYAPIPSIKLTQPLRISHTKGKCHVPNIIYLRGYVSFREGIDPRWLGQYMTHQHVWSTVVNHNLLRSEDSVSSRSRWSWVVGWLF